MIDKISFQANYVSSQKIKLFKKPNTTINTSFVELLPSSPGDIKAVYNRNLNWNNRQSFAAEIYEKLEDEMYEKSGRKFFALTLQENNFEKLIPEKILGLTEIILGSRRDRLKLKHLQTDPENKIDAPERKFKGIGTAILNGLKEYYSKRDITLESANIEYVINFYKANGFNMKKCLDCIIMEFIR